VNLGHSIVTNGDFVTRLFPNYFGQDLLLMLMIMLLAASILQTLSYYMNHIMCVTLYGCCYLLLFRWPVARENCSAQILWPEERLTWSTESTSQAFTGGSGGEKTGVTACRWGMSCVYFVYLVYLVM